MDYLSIVNGKGRRVKGESRIGGDFHITYRRLNNTFFCDIFNLKPNFKSIAKNFADLEMPVADRIDQEELEHVIMEAIKTYLDHISTSGRKK